MVAIGLDLQPFANWKPLRDLAVSAFTQFGDFPAVYSFRDRTTQEIMKFGGTGCLRRRLFANYIGGVGGGRAESTTQRIHAELFKRGMIECVEVAWCQTATKAEAHLAESRLRQAFKAKYGRSPVWDRQD